ncbi:MAG: oligosaccharide flippase family protein [Brevinematia bacterium]
MPSIKKNYFFNTIFIVLNTLIPLVTIPYLNRTLGPESMGKVTFAISFIMYFSTISGLINPLFSMREISKFRDMANKKDRIFSQLFFLNMLIKIFTIIIYLGIVFFLEKTKTNILLYFIIGTHLFFEIFSIEWTYQAHEEYGKIVSRNILCKLISVLMIFMLIRKSGDYYWYAVSTIVAMSLPFLFNFVLKGNLIRFKFSELNFSEMFGFLKGSFYLYLLKLFENFFSNIDKLLLGFMAGNTYLGLYNIADKVILLSTSFSTSLTTVLIPRISYLYYKNEIQNLYDKLDKAFKFILFITLPLMSGIFVVAPEIIAFFGDERYFSSMVTLRILSFNLLLLTLCNFLAYQINIPTGKEKFNIFGNILSLITALISMPFLSKFFYHNGAAISMVLSLTIQLIFLLIFSWKVAKNIFLDIKNLKYLIGAIITGITLFYTQGLINIKIVVIRLLISGLVGGIVYLLFLILIKDSVLLEIFNVIKEYISKFKKI